MSQLLEDLKIVRDFLTPDTWTTGGVAYSSRNTQERGKPIPPWSEKAVCFCFTGAILKVIPASEEEMDRARKSLKSDFDISGWEPPFWVNVRRRAVIEACGFKVSAEEYLVLTNAPPHVDYLYSGPEEIIAIEQFRRAWRWNDSYSGGLSGVHSRLDEAIHQEELRINGET